MTEFYGLAESVGESRIKQKTDKQK